MFKDIKLVYSKRFKQKNYTTVDPKQFVFFKVGTLCTRACDVQSWETKDCKAEAATAVQSWETRRANVKDCKRHAAHSWETNKGLQGRGDKTETVTNKKGDKRRQKREKGNRRKTRRTQ